MKNEPPTHVLGLTHPPIPVVRIGFIGLGNRGLLTLERYMLIEHVEIKALCEIRPGNLAKGQALLTKGGHPAAIGYAGENGWQQMCCNPDIDLIIICTDWLTHTPMATYAMEQGKHVAIEVPAAMTIAECWQLVDTAERTRRHCIMLENCCYDAFALTTLNMARQGLFGEIMHVEGAYIHDLRSMYFSDENQGGFHKPLEQGLLYGTHRKPLSHSWLRSCMPDPKHSPRRPFELPCIHVHPPGGNDGICPPHFRQRISRSTTGLPVGRHEHHPHPYRQGKNHPTAILHCSSTPLQPFTHHLRHTRVCTEISGSHNQPGRCA